MKEKRKLRTRVHKVDFLKNKEPKESSVRNFLRVFRGGTCFQNLEALGALLDPPVAEQKRISLIANIFFPIPRARTETRVAAKGTLSFHPLCPPRETEEKIRYL